MSTSSVNNGQAPDYDYYGPFANNEEGIYLHSDLFGNVLSLLKPKELGALEKVCKAWEQFIQHQWPRQCQIQLGLSSDIDPTPYLPPCPSHKTSLKLMSSSILDEDVYRHYIGEVGPVPPIPEAISLKKWNEPDPCDKATTIGKEYVWMYCPSYIEIDHEGVDLDKPDDPNDLDAPRLIRKEAEQIERGTHPEKKTLKVPVTINNIIELFKHPKTGNPSICEYVWDKIIEQHGNKRISASWECMRRNVIGRTLTFAAQQTHADELGVVITQLVHRLLFNFLVQTRSEKPNVYPDGRNPWTYARTSTLTHDSQNNNWPSSCGAGGPSGLRVRGSIFDDDHVGVAVVLPEEVQAIGP